MRLQAEESPEPGELRMRRGEKATPYDRDLTPKIPPSNQAGMN